MRCAIKQCELIDKHGELKQLIHINVEEIKNIIWWIGML